MARAEQEWRERVNRDYNVNRDHALVSALPQILGGGGGGGDRDHVSLSAESVSTITQNQNHRLHLHGQEDAAHADSNAHGVHGHGAHGGRGHGLGQRSKKTQRMVGRVVAARARQEALRDFIGQCSNYCDRGLFAKVPRR